MSTITVDRGLEGQLTGIAGSVMLCDSAGRPLGLFQPLPDSATIVELQLDPPYTIEETEALRKVRSGRTLDEILRGLEP